MVCPIMVDVERSLTPQLLRCLPRSFWHLHFPAYQAQKELTVGTFGVHNPPIHNRYGRHRLYVVSPLQEKPGIGAHRRGCENKGYTIFYNQVRGYVLFPMAPQLTAVEALLRTLYW